MGQQQGLIARNTPRVIPETRETELMEGNEGNDMEWVVISKAIPRIPTSLFATQNDVGIEMEVECLSHKDSGGRKQKWVEEQMQFRGHEKNPGVMQCCGVGEKGPADILQISIPAEDMHDVSYSTFIGSAHLSSSRETSIPLPTTTSSIATGTQQTTPSSPKTFGPNTTPTCPAPPPRSLIHIPRITHILLSILNILYGWEDPAEDIRVEEDGVLGLDRLGPEGLLVAVGREGVVRVVLRGMGGW